MIDTTSGCQTPEKSCSAQVTDRLWRSCGAHSDTQAPMMGLFDSFCTHLLLREACLHAFKQLIMRLRQGDGVTQPAMTVPLQYKVMT